MMEFKLAFELFLKKLRQLLKFRYIGTSAFPSRKITVDFEGLLVITQSGNSKLDFLPLVDKVLGTSARV